jgi:hypothetical protein
MELTKDGVVGEAETWRYLFGCYAYSSPATVFASPCVGNSCLSDAQRETNVYYIYDRLRKAGFTTKAACAVIGNIYQECKYDPGFWEDGSSYEIPQFWPKIGYGLIQWTPCTNFETWAVDSGLISAAGGVKATVRLADMAIKDPKQLIDEQVRFLDDDCNNKYYYRWFHSKPYGEDEEARNRSRFYYFGPELSYSDFKGASKVSSVAELTKAFHAHYVRSRDTEEVINQKRVKEAEKWAAVLKH